MGGSLRYLVNKGKTGDEDCIMEIIQRFTPLLRKYNRKLNYDEAFSDLKIAFIEIIYSLPLESHPYMKEEQIVSYINKSIINEYIKLSKKKKLINDKETRLNLEIVGVDYMKDIENRSFINYLLDKLTKLQKEILINKFIYGYTEVEIANQLHISKQAVNKTKKKALEILRSHLCL